MNSNIELHRVDSDGENKAQLLSSRVHNDQHLRLITGHQAAPVALQELLLLLGQFVWSIKNTKTTEQFIQTRFFY